MLQHSSGFLYVNTCLLFSSHYLEIFAQCLDRQNSVTQWHGTSAWQNRIEELAPPLKRISFWQNRNKFWQKEFVGPPSKMAKDSKNAYV